MIPSPSAYLNNPPEERARYKYDVDKDMTLLKFVDAEWVQLEVLTGLQHMELQWGRQML